MDNSSSALEAGLISFAFVLLLASLIANTLVTLAIFRYAKLRTNFNFYLLGIALAEIFYVFIATSQMLTTAFYGKDSSSYHICTFWLIADWIICGITANIMMMVSVDRLLCIYWPILYRKYQSRKYSILIMLVLLAYLLAVLLPPLLLTRGWGEDAVFGGVCQLDYEVHQGAVVLCLVIAFFVPDSVMIVSYVFLATKMREIGKRRSSQEARKNSHYTRKSELLAPKSAVPR